MNMTSLVKHIKLVHQSVKINVIYVEESRDVKHFDGMTRQEM